MELIVRTPDAVPPGERPVEVVERKGLGHPDTLCDGIAEHVSVHLSREYLARFGTILHHNVDKVLLVGGRARAELGGGEVLAPIDVYVAGRATREHRGARVDVDAIAVAACREWMRAHLHALEVDAHVRVHPLLRPGSGDLTDLFGRGARANDTSCGIGWAPRSALERAVLAVDRALADARPERPELGEDVKVMAIRRGRRATITLACALVGRHLRDLDAYRAAKEWLAARARDAAHAESGLEVEVEVNAADDLERGSIYVTVTGTSAEAGDDGEVGRGNRASGLIASSRMTSLEATAGKNPVTHVGKLYPLIADRIASSIVAGIEDVRDATVLLVSRIGSPVDEPQIVDVQASAYDVPPAALRAQIERIVRARLGELDALRADILAERVGLF